MPRVVCAGHVNLDVTLSVDALPEPDTEARIDHHRRGGGGSAANAAVTLAGLKVPTGLIGSVGADEPGVKLRNELNRHGVELTGLETVEGAETTVKYLIVDAAGEVAVLGNEGANEALGPADLESELLEGVEHVHLTSQRPDTAAALGRYAHEAGATVSFDPGRRLRDRDFTETFRLADIVFLNGREAAAVTAGEETVPADGIVVEKRGSAGAGVRWDGGAVSHEGFEIDSVDSTGAGDAFAAGFIAAWIDGADCQTAVAYANACGALATAEEGAWVAPSPSRVESLVGNQR